MITKVLARTQCGLLTKPCVYVRVSTVCVCLCMCVGVYVDVDVDVYVCVCVCVCVYLSLCIFEMWCSGHGGETDFNSIHFFLK